MNKERRQFMVSSGLALLGVVCAPVVCAQANNKLTRMVKLVKARRLIQANSRDFRLFCEEAIRIHSLSDMPIHDRIMKVDGLMRVFTTRRSRRNRVIDRLMVEV